MRRPLALALSLALAACATRGAPPRAALAPAPAAPALAPAPAPAPAPDPTDPTDPAPAPDAPLADGASVAPGINDPYRARPRARYWEDRLESEGREVYERRRDIVAALRLRPGMVVADVGAGTGLFTLPIAAAVAPTGRVYAVDLMPSFLAHIDARARQAGLQNITTVQASERDPGPLPEAALDLIFLSDAYHHIERPAEYLAALRRALRPGGELVLIDLHRIEGVSDPWILRHVRAGKDVVLAELRAAGFELVEEPPLLRANYVLRLRARP